MRRGIDYLGDLETQVEVTKSDYEYQQVTMGREGSTVNMMRCCEANQLTVRERKKLFIDNYVGQHMALFVR
jgi:hypothetical protein